jgi:hypothetical protein
MMSTAAKLGLAPCRAVRSIRVVRHDAQVSNQKAKSKLGWIPTFATYREGIVDAIRS